jgi:uncharacterized protein YkwD
MALIKDTAQLCHLMARAWSQTKRSAIAVAAAASIVALMVLAPMAGARHRARAERASRTCADANSRVGRAPRSALKAAVVCLINKQRQAHGLPALRANRRLDRSAQGWTNVMVADGEFSHGSNFSARIGSVGFSWSRAGENIATGFPTPRDVVNAWMGSAGHCQNILSSSFADVGTGIRAKPVRGFASGPATWTQDFALPVGHHPPSDNTGAAAGCPY